MMARVIAPWWNTEARRDTRIAKARLDKSRAFFVVLVKCLGLVESSSFGLAIGLPSRQVHRPEGATLRQPRAPGTGHRVHRTQGTQDTGPARLTSQIAVLGGGKFAEQRPSRKACYRAADNRGGIKERSDAAPAI